MRWQASIIKGYYAFVCPDRELIRRAAFDKEFANTPRGEAILQHLAEHPDCAYQTLPVEKAA